MSWLIGLAKSCNPSVFAHLSLPFLHINRFGGLEVDRRLLVCYDSRHSNSTSDVGLVLCRYTPVLENQLVMQSEEKYISKSS